MVGWPGTLVTRHPSPPVDPLPPMGRVDGDHRVFLRVDPARISAPTGKYQRVQHVSFYDAKLKTASERCDLNAAPRPRRSHTRHAHNDPKVGDKTN